MTADRAVPELFAVDVSSVEGETVLALHGELDISAQQLFVTTLAGVDETVARIVLDLSDLAFIDCANICAIHQTRIVAGLRGTFLELRSPNPHLLRIMELTGLLPSANGEQLRPAAAELGRPLAFVGVREKEKSEVLAAFAAEVPAGPQTATSKKGIRNQDY